MTYQKSAIDIGTIIVYTGLIANIPIGWVLCDGTNSTPDLRGKFARGAAAATEAGGTGGSDTVTLSTANLPVHNHTWKGYFTGVGSYPNIIDDVASSQSSGNIASTGGGGAHNNLPVYYDVLYIMKV